MRTQRPSLHVFHVLLAVIALAVATGGCSGRPLITRVPEMTPAATRTASPEPTATFTPLPPQPPRMLGRSPARGEEQPPDAALELRFDQPMATSTVEEAITIEPAVPGSFTWDAAGTVLRFQPTDDGWDRDATYRVTVSTDAESAAGLSLEDVITFEFRTVGYLEVANAFPLPDSEDVALDAAIRVVFNRPVVPLTGIAQQDELPEPIVFAPSIQGEGTWTNTSIYTFQPSAPLLPGTRYTASIRSGLRDTTGGILPESYTWEFVTAAPAVERVSPEEDARNVSPKAGVTITFNQAMDARSTQERFALVPLGSKTSVLGRFSWLDDTTMVYTPTQPLEEDVTYEAVLEEGALALSGEAATDEELRWEFTVAPLPEVVSTSPRNNATDVELYDGLKITFSSPISPTTFEEHLTIAPATELYTYWSNDDTVAHVSAFLKPSTAYTVTIPTTVLGRYGDPLQEKVAFRFRTGPLHPSISSALPTMVTTHSTYLTPTIPLRHVNVSRADLALYELDHDTFVRLTGPENWREWGDFAPDPEASLRRWSQPLEGALNVEAQTAIPLASPRGSRLASGFYYLEVSSPETSSPVRQLLVVTDTTLTLKNTQTEALVWATDLHDGEPVPGVALTFYNGKGRAIAEATTGEDGVALVDLPRQDAWAPLIVIGDRDGAVAIVTRDWSQGISPWEFGLFGYPYEEQYRGYLYTDRQIYRPGQTVYFKGILREEHDARYSPLPEGAAIPVSVYDAEGREVWRDTLTVNDMGTIHGEFALSEGASLGYYQLQAVYDEQSFTTDLQVAAYRAPEFQAQITLDEDDYLHGDEITAIVEADYFFGGPLPDAEVEWTVSREPYFFDRWEGEGYYDWTDYDINDDGFGPTGEFVTEGTTTTDAEGRAVITLPADISEQTQSQRYIIEASITDLNNQVVSTRTAAIVHKGTFYTGLAAVSYVGSAGEEMSVRAITVDTDGITVTRQALEVVLYEQEWYSVREQADDGNYYWTNRVRETAVATQTVTTDNRGQALVTFTPEKGGTYKVRTTGTDAFANTVRSATYLWVSDREYINWGQEDTARIELVADKKAYHPGDTAEILIPSPYQGETLALLTIERGHVLEHRIVELAGNSEVLRLPIEPEYAPNIFVSIVISKGADETYPMAGFRIGYVMLPVSTEQQELTVSITPDRDEPYKPRERATYDVQVTDYTGTGVSAEVSLQLVDLAVESLTGADPRDIVQVFYAERGLGVSTATTLVTSADRLTLERPQEGKGGGGAGLGADMVRQDFPDTAFWDPVVRTDADGRARVTVELPDNLTTWRMRAQAVTADTEVGKAQADIVTNLDVMVRPVTPRFMVIGDRPVLGAVLHNNTDEDLTMVVRLEAEGVAVRQAEQTVDVPAHGRQTVQWPTEVDSARDAVLAFSVDAGVYGDAVQLRLPVYHPSTPETVGTSGVVDDRTIERVRVPEEADQVLGELAITLEPSLAAGMREGLDYLRAYPYDSIEQAVSRFLPNVVASRALQQLDIDRPLLDVNLAEQVGMGLQRIYALQNLDGGWGWWPNEESSPDLTAYVVFGMAEARAADYAVDAASMDRAIDYLYEWLNANRSNTLQERDRRATVLHALATAGRGDHGRTVALYDRREGMSLYAKAYLAMALQTLDPEETSRLDTLVSELMGEAIVTATGAHWEEAERSAWAMNTDTRTTAIVLKALVQLTPDNALVSNAVRWLMLARTSGRWETPQENAWSILALTDYMTATGELVAEFDFDLWVNGINEASGSVDANSVDESVAVRVPIHALQRGEDNGIIMERSEGPGRLYYSAFLHYYLPGDQIPALNRGIIVQREYSLADAPERPIAEAQVNDVVNVKLTMIAPNDLHYLVLEDPLPAGCEAIDTSLETTSRYAQGPALDRVSEETPWWWGNRWASHSELRDEKVVLFAGFLPRGTYEYTYSVRCTTPGEYKAMPTTAYEMYAADVFGRSAGAAFTVKD
jgi:uncharacterized protein YfaS (alpha-2-macroglobulin family)